MCEEVFCKVTNN